MPYIPKAERNAPHLAHLVDVNPKTPAELAYCVYALAVRFVKVRRHSWSTLSDVSKAIDGALDEWKRRWVWPHEDSAIIRNGDVL